MRETLIKTEKGDICPICQQPIRSPNFWVKYHISYNPELIILACRYCNYTEWCLRNNKIDRPRCANPNRINQVLQLKYKFDIIRSCPQNGSTQIVQ